ncbi:MAG: EAL domain-containing protein, partial [Cyanobacteria bacterium J06648_11]
MARWQHPERGLVSPGRFIPCLETTGLIVPVGIQIFEQACRQLAFWHQKGADSLTMSVNLSTRQFSSPTLLDVIDRVLQETSVNPARLKL